MNDPGRITPAEGVRVKVCGLTSVAATHAAAEVGAAYVGFVFFEKSSRAVTHSQAAALAAETPVGVCKVGLVVDASDAELDALTAAVGLDMLQLHGAETPERVASVRSRWGLPVMKAVSIAGPDDVARLDAYEAVSDQLLCDAKAQPGDAAPGGNGVAFDWSLLAGRAWRRPWMLAGGLTPETAADAVARSGARQLDVSTGVETAPGIKDPEKMRAFIAAARAGG